MAETRLSQTPTCWSLVLRAHAAADGAVARQALFDRYGGVVLRYLRGAVKDPALVEDLFQEFALRVLRGDFHRANPDCGRFRDYMKTAICRLVGRYQARQAGVLTLEIDPA